jgi:hypothetical protein
MTDMDEEKLTPAAFAPHVRDLQSCAIQVLSFLADLRDGKEPAHPLATIAEWAGELCYGLHRLEEALTKEE